MKNDVTDKSIMRRYLDDMYTQEEARGLLSRLKDDIHAPMLDELATDVWKEAAMEELTTGMEREKYKEEASRLLKRIEHKKRTWFRRIVLTVASASAVVLLIFGESIYWVIWINSRFLIWKPLPLMVNPDKSGYRMEHS